MKVEKMLSDIPCLIQNRNRFNKIFGGFLMRSAVELAWANGYVYWYMNEHSSLPYKVSFII